MAHHTSIRVPSKIQINDGMALVAGCLCRRRSNGD
jgi:hypothetical protein